MNVKKLFISTKIVVNNEFLNGGILIESDGKISKIVDNSEIQLYNNAKNLKIINVGDRVIMPGIIDSHVHINEPGRTDWEGFKTATKAAAAGGITSIVDMPLNSIPPNTTLSNFQEKLKNAEGQCYVDIAFWGGVIHGNQNQLMDLVQAGVVGFKCFMCPSGVDEFPYVTLEDIESTMEILENTNSLLAFHAEVEENISVEGDPTVYETFLNTRPPSMELNAIREIIKLSEKYRVKTHIVHLSSAEALLLIKEAKKSGLNLTVETCHHYLNFNAEDIPDKATTYKCTPPIRNLENRELLWEALKSGTIDMVVSDHSPCTPDLKELESGNFLKAWGGISSLQFGLSLFWTQLKNRGLSIFEINKFMTHGPAMLTGLHKSKGLIAVNYDADFVIWEPDVIIEIETSMIQHKNKITPYLGQKLYGRIHMTVVRGETVYENGEIFDPPIGKFLKREL